VIYSLYEPKSLKTKIPAKVAGIFIFVTYWLFETIKSFCLVIKPIAYKPIY